MFGNARVDESLQFESLELGDLRGYEVEAVASESESGVDAGGG